MSTPLPGDRPDPDETQTPETGESARRAYDSVPDRAVTDPSGEIVYSGGGGIGLWAKPLNGTVIAGCGAAIIALQDDGHVSLQEGLAIIVSVLGSFLAISLIRGAKTGWRRYARAIAGGLAAFAGALGTSLSDAGWPPPATQVLIAVLALLNALPVWWSPNAAKSDIFRSTRA
jgi:hypothetical protein